MLKTESEKRRLLRDNEDMEKETIKHQLLNLQHECEEQFSLSEKNQRYCTAHYDSSILNPPFLQTNDIQTWNHRDLKVTEMKLMEAEQKIVYLKEQCFEKDEQVIINECE
jgi:hypothetical protein